MTRVETGCTGSRAETEAVEGLNFAAHTIGWTQRPSEQLISCPGLRVRVGQVETALVLLPTGPSAFLPYQLRCSPGSASLRSRPDWRQKTLWIVAEYSIVCRAAGAMMVRQLAGQMPCRSPGVMTQCRAPPVLTHIHLPARPQLRRHASFSHCLLQSVPRLGRMHMYRCSLAAHIAHLAMSYLVLPYQFVCRLQQFPQFHLVGRMQRR